uniref:ribonuclease H n=1 Tax=Salarias fasciatus TaxID=181472 RepID=A0A672HFB4_SALFA
MRIGGKDIDFMVDTGARYSSIHLLPPGASITPKTVSLTGFEGKPNDLHFLSPVTVTIASQIARHSFIFAPQCPINLLGRDLLIRLCPMIKCTADGMILIFPDGSTFHCSQQTDSMLMMEANEELPEPMRPLAPQDPGVLPFHVGLPPTFGLVIFCNIEPVTFSFNPEPVYQKQYPTSPAGEEGISETIDGLLEAGVLVPLSEPSPWNTPILPVQKKEGKYRMVHDLRAINAAVTTPQLPVPNPFSALGDLTPSHKFFTCIDLANAFFCLPLSPTVAPIFAFTWKGRQYSYSRLPQGFELSPGIFNAILKSLLTGLVLPDGVLLVQYVDDLLLAAPTESTCLEATKSLLLWLHSKGFKCSRGKEDKGRLKRHCINHTFSSRHPLRKAIHITAWM